MTAHDQTSGTVPPVEAAEVQSPAPSAQPLPDLTESYILENTEPTFESTRQRMKLFVQAYLTNGRNGAAAARAAGYSENAAAQIANRLLKAAYVQKLIRNVLGEDPYQIAEAEEGVRQHLLAVRDAHLVDYFTLDEKGNPKLDLLNLTREQGAAIQSIKVNRWGEIEIKLKDSVKAAELLGRHHKMFTDKTEWTGKDGQALVPPVINVTFVDAPRKEEVA